MDIHKVTGKLPLPMRRFVVPYHKYTGPYNPLHDQLDEYDQLLGGQEPYNAVDAISMRHDICYRDAKRRRENTRVMMKCYRSCMCWNRKVFGKR